MDTVEEILPTLKEEERAAYEEFKQKVGDGISDFVCLRYIALTKFKVPEAIKVKETMEKYLDELRDVPEEDVIREIKTNKMVFGGRDDQGRRIIQFHYKLHDPKAQAFTCTLKYYLYLMDIALSDWESIKSGMTVICWMEGSGWSNFDFSGQIKMNEMFLSFMPMSLNMLGRSVLVDSPWYVKIAMTMMKPFMAAETLEKVMMCKAEDLPNFYNEEALATNTIFLDSVEQNLLTRWK